MALRDRWPTQTVFILAAIGSAVGLGNIWRYPFLAHKYGGGAFLLPYLIALFIIGIPLLILEFALGQKIQKGAVDSFAAIKRKFSGIGWWALISSFVVITYYAVIMSWSMIYLFTSFGTQWKTDSKTYFFSNVLQLSDNVNVIGNIVPSIFFGLLVSWVLIYFCVWKGIKSVSKVIIPLVVLPLILLIVLLIRALTLPGALSGIAIYLKPDFSAIFDPQIWIAAFAQIFFSLSLAFGVMIAYSSYNKKDQDVLKNAYTVGITDSLVAILAGFVVFGTLGFMAHQEGVAFDEVVASGPGLAFVAFPKALSLMPFASFFSILFFLTLITLAIASAFSLVEAVTTVIRDKIKNAKREIVAFIVCLFGFLGGIIYTTNGGLYFLDIVDHFVTNYNLILIGILECIAVGWIYGADKLRVYINSVSERKIGLWWNFSIKYLIPLVLFTVLLLQLKTELTQNYEGYPNWAILIGWFIVIGTFAIAFLIPQKKVRMPKET